MYRWISEEYADCDRNWATIDTVVRIAKGIGAARAQVALSWIADRPGVIAPIVGARTVYHLRSNLRAADLKLNNELLLDSRPYSSRRSIHDHVMHCAQQRPRVIDVKCDPKQFGFARLGQQHDIRLDCLQFFAGLLPEDVRRYR